MKNVVLIGFMGTGKTSTGKILAAKLGFSFIDTDYKIELVHEMSISRMFAEHGEAYFRQKEAEMIAAVADCRSAVISTGGGVVLNSDNMRALKKNGVIVALKASVEAILDRTGRKNNRPLLEQEDRRDAVLALLDSRRDLYGQADFVVDTTELTPLQTADEIVQFVRSEVGIHA